MILLYTFKIGLYEDICGIYFTVREGPGYKRFIQTTAQEAARMCYKKKTKKQLHEDCIYIYINMQAVAYEAVSLAMIKALCKH